MLTKDKKSRLGFLHRYPIVSFFILVWVLGTGGTYLVMQGVIPSGLALISVLSASIRGIIMTDPENLSRKHKRIMHQQLSR